MDIWPFRKSRCIYRWDDEYSVIAEPITDDSIYRHLSWTCPDHYYARVQRINTLFNRDNGVANITLYTHFYRGSSVLAQPYQAVPWQMSPGYEICFDPDYVVFSDAAAGLYMFPLQRDIHLIPGDRFDLYWIGLYTNVTWTPATIILHAYYF